LVFCVTHCGRTLPEEDQRAKREVLPVLGLFRRIMGGRGARGAGRKAQSARRLALGACRLERSFAHPGAGPQVAKRLECAGAGSRLR